MRISLSLLFRQTMVSFVSLKKELTSTDADWKMRVFCIRYISKRKQKPAKINTEQCLTHVNEPACEIWSCFDDFHFLPKSLVPSFDRTLQLSPYKIKPSNFALGPHRMTQRKIRRFCMGMIGPKNAHISASNRSKPLIFGDWAFFIMLFPNM